MPSGLVPRAAVAQTAPRPRQHPSNRSPHAGPAPDGPPQVTVTVAMTLTGEDALVAADEVKDGLWSLANQLPAGATVVNVAMAVVPAMAHRDPAGSLASAPAFLPALPSTLGPAGAQPGPGGAQPGPVGGAPLKIYPSARIATLHGSSVRLTRREYDLLLHLARHPGRVFTRHQLSHAVWQEGFMRGERTIDVHIHRLRIKLGGRGPVITTVRGVGYRLDAPERVWIATT